MRANTLAFQRFTASGNALSRESTRGWGVVKSLGNRNCADRRHPRAQIFFLSPEILGFQTKSKNSKAESFQRLLQRKGFHSRYLFSSPRGGRSKVWPVDPGTGGQAARIFSRISENFFCGGPEPCKKSPRNSRGGGR